MSHVSVDVRVYVCLSVSLGVCVYSCVCQAVCLWFICVSGVKKRGAGSVFTGCSHVCTLGRGAYRLVGPLPRDRMRSGVLLTSVPQAQSPPREAQGPVSASSPSG